MNCPRVPGSQIDEEKVPSVPVPKIEEAPKAETIPKRPPTKLEIDEQPTPKRSKNSGKRNQTPLNFFKKWTSKTSIPKMPIPVKAEVELIELDDSPAKGNLNH